MKTPSAFSATTTGYPNKAAAEAAAAALGPFFVAHAVKHGSRYAVMFQFAATDAAGAGEPMAAAVAIAGKSIRQVGSMSVDGVAGLRDLRAFLARCEAENAAIRAGLIASLQEVVAEADESATVAANIEAEPAAALNVADALRSLRAAGYEADESEGTVVVRDPVHSGGRIDGHRLVELLTDRAVARFIVERE